MWCFSACGRIVRQGTRHFYLKIAEVREQVRLAQKIREAFDRIGELRIIAKEVSPEAGKGVFDLFVDAPFCRLHLPAVSQGSMFEPSWHSSYLEPFVDGASCFRWHQGPFQHPRRLLRVSRLLAQIQAHLQNYSLKAVSMAVEKSVLSQLKPQDPLHIDLPAYWARSNRL